MAYKNFFIDLPTMPIQSGTLNSTTNLSTWTVEKAFGQLYHFTKIIYLGSTVTTRKWQNVSVTSYTIQVHDIDSGTYITISRPQCTPYTATTERKGVSVGFMSTRITATNVEVIVTANYTYKSTSIVEPNIYNVIDLGGQKFKLKSDQLMGYPFRLTLRSGEIVTVDQFKNQYEQGIDYTISSGNDGMGYYYRNGFMIQESCACWFGNTIGTPISGDIIRIYKFPAGEDYNDWSYIESNISSFKLCYLQFDGSSWYIKNDYS